MAVLVVGDINVDIVLRIPDYPAEGGEAVASSALTRLGGSGCNTAFVLARLGVPTELAGHLGRDPFGELAFRQVSRSGIDPCLVDRGADYATGFFMITITRDGQRTMFGSRASNALPFPVDRIAEHFPSADFLHVSGYSFLERDQWRSVRELVERARARHIRVALDPGLEAARRATERVFEILPLVEALLISREELAVLSAGDSVEQMVAPLMARGPGMIAVKLGASGSRLFQNGATWDAPPFRPEQVRDTTGAGDCFDAGFLYGLLHHYAPRDCLKLGNAVACIAISTDEAVAGLERVQDLKTRVMEMAEGG